MRTTLTIDDELAAQIEDLRRREGSSLKRVVNDLLREGLRSRQHLRRAKRYRTPTRRLRLLPGLDPLRLNDLVDELDASGDRDRSAQKKRGSEGDT